MCCMSIRISLSASSPSLPVSSCVFYDISCFRSFDIPRIRSAFRLSGVVICQVSVSIRSGSIHSVSGTVSGRGGIVLYCVFLRCDVFVPVWCSFVCFSCPVPTHRWVGLFPRFSVVYFGHELCVRVEVVCRNMLVMGVGACEDHSIRCRAGLPSLRNRSHPGWASGSYVAFISTTITC